MRSRPRGASPGSLLSRGRRFLRGPRSAPQPGPTRACDSASTALPLRVWPPPPRILTAPTSRLQHARAADSGGWRCRHIQPVLLAREGSRPSRSGSPGLRPSASRPEVSSSSGASACSQASPTPASVGLSEDARLALLRPLLRGRVARSRGGAGSGGAGVWGRQGCAGQMRRPADVALPEDVIAPRAPLWGAPEVPARGGGRCCAYLCRSRVAVMPPSALDSSELRKQSWSSRAFFPKSRNP